MRLELPLFISENDDKWKYGLYLKLSRILERETCDFLIFCALTKERAALENTDANLGELKILHGLDCQSVTIGNHCGFCIVSKRAGLVNMAILSAKAIEIFQPKIVAMSGICAGVCGESNLLDLIIGKVCWEYQTGKYKGEKFEQEPYQSNINHQLSIEIGQFLENSANISKLIENIDFDELEKFKVFLAPISSGSAVIASAPMMDKIGAQHRKMAGLEMEMFSMYEAAAQSLCKPLFFGAKSVVDLGDSSKGDQYHAAAAIISSRFVVNFIAHSLKIIAT